MKFRRNWNYVGKDDDHQILDSDKIGKRPANTSKFYVCILNNTTAFDLQLHQFKVIGSWKKRNSSEKKEFQQSAVLVIATHTASPDKYSSSCRAVDAVEACDRLFWKIIWCLLKVLLIQIQALCRTLAQNTVRSPKNPNRNTMSESYDPGEGPSSSNSQDKCSLCDFTTYNRQDIVLHLIEHIMSKGNNSMKVINIALNQMRHFDKQENRSASPRNDGSEDNSNKNAEEPGLTVPRMNAQGNVHTFPCKKCDFKAVTKIEYWSHIRIHINPSKLMCCHKCPFVTEYKHHFGYHLLNHTGAKPHKCSECSYTCVNNSMLSSHMKSHSCLYPYRCKDCEYVSKYFHTLKQHLRKYNHQSAAMLNEDGTLTPIVIDVYGTRRGPKRKTNKSNDCNRLSTAAATATETAKRESTTSTSTQTVISNEINNDSNSSNSNDHNAETSTSTSTQALPSTSSSSASTSFICNMFTGKTKNFIVQKDEQTGQETVYYPFQYNHHLLTSLNMSTQQLSDSSFALSEMMQTTSTTAPRDDIEWQNSTTNTTMTDEPEFFEDSTAENSNMPLDLTSGSQANIANTKQLPSHQLPLNLAKVASMRRRKGVVEKENDSDEEATRSEKRLCQSTSPQAVSAMSISLTPPQAASIPSTSLMATSTPSTSLMTASVAVAASSSPRDGAVDTNDSADPNQECEELLSHNRLPSSQDCFICPHCGIHFPDHTVYIAHKRYHGNAEPFTCNVCGTSYGNRRKFNLHIFNLNCS